MTQCVKYIYVDAGGMHDLEVKGYCFRVSFLEGVVDGA